MGWHCTASIYQSQSLSQRKKLKTEEGHFVPNESFPLEILPSIKNQIKHRTSAHRLKTHQLAYPEFMCT